METKNAWPKAAAYLAGEPPEPTAEEEAAWEAINDRRFAKLLKWAEKRSKAALAEQFANLWIVAAETRHILRIVRGTMDSQDEIRQILQARVATLGGFSRHLFAKHQTKSAETSKRAKESVEIRHNKPDGSRSKRAKLLAAWASGKYKTKVSCVLAEHARIGMSYDTADKTLRGVPKPAPEKPLPSKGRLVLRRGNSKR